MDAPNAGAATVAREKITEYLLDPHSKDGGAKARLFLRFGFSPEAWEVMALAFRQHVRAYPVVAARPGYRDGTNDSVVGALSTPDGRNPLVRSVWYIAKGDTTPRLISAYPE